MLDEALPRGLKTFAEREFADETLVWAAKPDVRIAFWLSFGIWFFAIPWTAFSLFWISLPAAALYEAYSGVELGAPKGAPTLAMWAFALWGVPFVLIGFGMLSAPFFTLKKGGRTLFVLTDKRLTTLQGGSQVKVTSIYPQEISGFSRKEGPDGRGTLVVSLGYERDSDGDRVPKSAEFGVIADVRKAEELVRALADRKA
jgi:hypothetical protein